LTPLGLAVVPFVLFFAFVKPRGLLLLLVATSVFEASSVFNGSVGSLDLGIPLFHFIEIFIAFHLAVLLFKDGSILPDPGDPLRRLVTPLLLFWAWAFASALVLPHVFAGMPVYEPHGGIDQQYAGLTPLRWSLSNLAQAVYLSLNVSTVLYAIRTIRTPSQVKQLVGALSVAVVIVVSIGIAQQIAMVRGWSFPYEVLNNNVGRDQGFSQDLGDVRRITSTFTEPSFAGSFLSAVAIGMVASFLRGRRTWVWFIAAAAACSVLLATTATTGYVAFAVMLGVLFLYFSPFRGSDRIRRFLAKGWLTLILPLLGIAALAMLAMPGLWEAAFTLTADKSDGLSFLHRLSSDLSALTIFADTWGMGVGLGSNRPSSLLMAFLSSVGIVGTVFFAAFLWRVAKAFPGRNAPSALQLTFWALVALLVSQLIAVPDMNRPVLWTLIVLVVVQLRPYPSKQRLSAPRLASHDLNLGHALGPAAHGGSLPNSQRIPRLDLER
jgi:hypothetical protein